MKSKKESSAPLASSWQVLEKTLNEASFIVYDLETTGGNPEKNGIMEIGALKYVNGTLESSFYAMVNPMRPLSPIVRRITGISPKDYKKSPPIEEVFPSFLEFIGDSLLISHNAQGDLKFLVHFAETVCSHKLDNFYLCTHLLGQKFFASAPDKSLVGLARHLELPHDEKSLHRAPEDAQLTWELFRVILERLADHGIQSVKEAVRFQGDYASGLRLGPAIDFESLRGQLPSSPGVFSLLDRKRRPLFTSSCLNLKREVLSLRNLNALPRKLMRAVLDATEPDFETSPSLFAAMLREAELTQTDFADKPFLSSQWTGRFIGSVFLCEDDDELRVALGPLLVPGLIASFGPVRDYKSLNVKLEQVCQNFENSSLSQTGLYLKLPDGKDKTGIEEDMRALFSEHLAKHRKQLWWERLQFKNLLNFGLQKELSKRLLRTQELLGLNLLENLDDLLAHHGILFIPNEDAYLVYPIVHSSPLEPISMQMDPDEWLGSEDGMALRAELEAESKAPRKGDYTLKALLKVNAVLWTIYVQAQQRQARERFVPLS